jgi:hypothetical protein
MALADGVVRVWISATRHGDEWFAQMQGNVANINLDLLNQAFVEEGEPMPGRIEGRFSVVGPLTDPSRLSGQGRIELHESDLISSDIIGSVFRAVGIGRDAKREPRGEGSVNVRIDGGNLTIDQFRYNNRGIDIYMNGEVQDVWLGKAALIDIYAVGSLRPLKGLKLPGASDLDRLLQGLQSTLATIHATGTVGAPQTQVVNPASLSRSFLRAMFGGDQAE